MSSATMDEEEAEVPLPISIVPVVVVGLGAVLMLVGLFLPQLASNDVANIVHNSGIESHPARILGAIGGGLAAARYYRSGSKKAANSTIFVGLWFTAWSLFDGFSSQLFRIGCNTCKLDTSPGIGLWALGVGSAIIALGGLMMRFPNNSFGLASGSVSTLEEQSRIGSQTKSCPACAETIKAEAKICRFCHTNLDTYNNAS